MLLNPKTLTVALALSVFAARSASAEEPSAEAPPPPAAIPSPMVHGLVLGGASTSTMFGVGSAAGHAGLGLVVGRSGLMRFAPVLDADLGSTFGGLAMKTFTLSGSAIFVLDSVRLGIGPELGYTRLSRAPTSTLGAINAVGIGLVGLVSVDVWRSAQDDALFVGLRPRVSVLDNADSPLVVTHHASLFSGALVVGLRF